MVPSSLQEEHVQSKIKLYSKIRGSWDCIPAYELCLSGYLPLYQTVAAERHPANLNVPIFMAHGTADPVVPLIRAHQSRDFLGVLGYDVEWKEYPMEHTLSLLEIEDIGTWFTRILK